MRKWQNLLLTTLAGLSLSAHADVPVPEHRGIVRDFQTPTQHIRSARAKDRQYGEMLIFWNKPKPYGAPSADRLLTNGDFEEGVSGNGQSAVERIGFKDGTANVIFEIYPASRRNSPDHPEGAVGEIQTFRDGQWSKDFIYSKTWQFR